MFRKVSIVTMALAMIFTASVAFCGTDAIGESDAVKVTRTQGLCSHHGGYNAATKKCRDGTTPAENAAAAIAAEEAAKPNKRRRSRSGNANRQQPLTTSS